MKVTVDLNPKVVAWLRELAPLGLYGIQGTVEEVAARFICRGVERELRGPDGFLRSHPKLPRKSVR